MKEIKERLVVYDVFNFISNYLGKYFFRTRQNTQNNF